MTEVTEEELREYYGDLAVTWAKERAAESPYPFDYWLRMAWAHGGLGRFSSGI